MNREEYNSLNDEWFYDTNMLSDVEKTNEHKNFYLLMDGGESIVPYIIEDFENLSDDRNLIGLIHLITKIKKHKIDITKDSRFKDVYYMMEYLVQYSKREIRNKKIDEILN